MSSWSRRGFLRLAAGAGAASLVGCGDNWLDVGIDVDDDYDAVLDHVHETAPEFEGGLSNHAPMVLDTLVALGSGARVARWARHYTHQLDALPAAEPLSAVERDAALGDANRQSAWIATFLGEVETIDPRALLARELPRLASGWMAAHGILRTAHAMRALEREDTPSRRRELAHGLGYWSARHDLLPGTPGTDAVDGRDVVTALANVPIVPSSRRKDGGLIIERLAVLEGDAKFAAAIAAVDLSAQPVEVALHDLVAAAARLYVAEGSNDISLLHGVTATAALSLLVPWLDADTLRLSLGYAFQHVAALHAVTSHHSGVPDKVSAPTRTASALAAHAAESSEEHVLKLSEAALREYAITGYPELLAAAELVQRS